MKPNVAELNSTRYYGIRDSLKIKRRLEAELIISFPLRAISS